jgi:transcriptional regulator with XRE-family HTH domain
MPPVRLPSPRVLAPGYPRDPLREDAIRERLSTAGVDVPVAAVVRQLAECQRLVGRLVELRDERGTPMSGLARKLGVSDDRVERMLAGRTWPSADLVGLLAEEFGRPLRFTRDGADEALWERREELAAGRARAAAAREAATITDASADAVVRRLRQDEDLWRRVSDMMRRGLED